MRRFPLASAPWQFRDATRGAPWRTAVVPGCVHRDLRRHGLIPDPFQGANELELQWIEARDWEYRARFTVPPALLAEEVVDLVADGLDTVATVRLNGREVGRTENMFLGHRWDVKRLLRPGQNELSILFGSALRYIRTHRTGHRPREFNDPVGGGTRLRKEQCQFGWDWAPRLVTAGIWRDLRLEAWTGNRLESIRVTQEHRRDGSVVLTFAPELARPDPRATVHGTVALDGRVVAQIHNQRSTIKNPKLWWPNGQGAQPLYRLEVEVTLGDGRVVGPWRRRVGLRTVALDRRPDRWGESFRFVVNGRPVFAQGANWIPAHCFVAGLTRADYARDLRSAVAAHMNMLRAWGGGIYESEDFFDLCDELGLLVWQDFMFACTLYPGDAAFVASVRAEAAQQVRRLRHHACLALWCGNNEVFGLNREALRPGTRQRADYDRLFHQALPAAVAAHDGVTPYWPSSPWRGDDDTGPAAGAARGDTHFWEVWHARKPVKEYERHAFRFTSEFGMQSFASAETQATFCPPGDGNVFGPTMTNHQKGWGGNQLILDYVSRLYRFPKDQDALLFLSQLNQAECMRTAVEHYRRNRPRCMGAIYWQLNDCWPAASWSSLEFSGRWKALHHAARRFFAPALVSAHVPGEELAGIINRRGSTVRRVHLHTAYDAPRPARGILRWDLFHLNGRVLQRGRQAVTLRPGTSVKRRTLDLAAPLAQHGRDHLYLRIALDVAGRRASEETVLLTAPRFLALPQGRAAVTWRGQSARRMALTFRAPVFLHRFAFDLPGVAHRSSDNYFDLYPGEPKTVVLEFDRPQRAARLRRRLTQRSLVDTY